MPCYTRVACRQSMISGTQLEQKTGRTINCYRSSLVQNVSWEKVGPLPQLKRDWKRSPILRIGTVRQVCTLVGRVYPP